MLLEKERRERSKGKKDRNGKEDKGWVGSLEASRKRDIPDT